jgi:hypothetical protein
MPTVWRAILNHPAGHNRVVGGRAQQGEAEVEPEVTARALREEGAAGEEGPSQQLSPATVGSARPVEEASSRPPAPRP